jgi:hypothetical protein
MRAISSKIRKNGGLYWGLVLAVANIIVSKIPKKLSI